jgi:hypothetical protein
VWELIFLMVVMKIPILYLCWVVWWAIKAEPRPDEGAALPVALPPDGPGSGPEWRFRGRPRPRPARPHGGPVRAYERVGRLTAARARR